MTLLSIDDPLADQPVLITISMPKSKAARDERPLLVSIGVEGQMPVVRTGSYADIPDLIEQAWTAFGVAHPEPPAAAKAVEEETVVAPPPAQKPKQKPMNLSLF